MDTTPRLRLLHLALLLVALLLALAGCSGAGGAGGGSDSAVDSSGGSVAEPAPEVADEGADDAGARGEQAGGAAGRATAMERAVVSTGEVQLQSGDVGRARAEVLRLTRGWGGVVADEQSSSDDEGRTTYTSMTLRVPTARFDAAMEALGEVATLVDRSRTSEDVTTQVVDVSARVRAQQQSVRRIEALLAEAEDLRDVVSIEGDLAQRQAELDSLRSQQAYLDDQTSLSTIGVVVDSPATASPDEEPGGFVGGLRSGWTALGASVAVLLTAVGAVLPFAVLLGVVAVPAAVVVRRRRSRPATGGVAA
ncbi:DUF4349 domain-containing protein [Nocardioides marmoraquaticus]